MFISKCWCLYVGLPLHQWCYNWPVAGILGKVRHVWHIPWMPTESHRFVLDSSESVYEKCMRHAGTTPAELLGSRCYTYPDETWWATFHTLSSKISKKDPKERKLQLHHSFAYATPLQGAPFLKWKRVYKVAQLTGGWKWGPENIGIPKWSWHGKPLLKRNGCQRLHKAIFLSTHFTAVQSWAVNHMKSNESPMKVQKQIH